ncbi:hypothetical protein BHE74_00000380 [Ensete ventricosum]|nr:hypothetical protein BHE74_00000380 [Ensete ventricosum]RZR83696.1 hypothetical protein BHM03_00010381 [Ensete ventricosum]
MSGDRARIYARNGVIVNGVDLLVEMDQVSKGMRINPSLLIDRFSHRLLSLAHTNLASVAVLGLLSVAVKLYCVLP